MLKRKVSVAVVAVVAGVAVVAALGTAGGSPPPPPGPPPNPNLAFLNGLCPSCCPDWGCGTNGAWLGQNIVFHELDASGQKANSAGVRVGAFRDPQGNKMELDVDHDNLRGIKPNKVLTDTDLVGATLELIRDGLPREDKQVFKLRIVGYAKTTFWADPLGVAVPVYAFTFEPVGSQGRKPEALCRDPAEGGTRWEPIKGMAVIFRGDRYDEKAKTVKQTGGTDTWFNIACAGTTVAKMHLLRHTWAGNRDGQHPTTENQRQAVLKMLVADYCGTGKPFTIDGHALLYAYNKTWEPSVDFTTAASLDAVWNASHAVCLNVPRLKDMYTHIRDKIVTQCAAVGYTIKACEPGLMSELKSLQPGDAHPWSGYAVSVNPPSAP